MNKYFLLILIHTFVNSFIPISNLPKLKGINHYSLTKPFAFNKYKLIQMNNNNNNNNDHNDETKNKSKIFKIKFDNNNLDDNSQDYYLILYRIYIYLLIFINWILIAYIIENI